jgi:hypothetical protein
MFEKDFLAFVNTMIFIPQNILVHISIADQFHYKYPELATLFSPRNTIVGV